MGHIESPVSPCQGIHPNSRTHAQIYLFNFSVPLTPTETFAAGCLVTLVSQPVQFYNVLVQTGTLTSDERYINIVVSLLY